VNSLKSTCVVLVLAGVLYGVYVTLNAPAPSNHAHSHADIQPPAIDFGPASQAPSLSPPTTTLTPLVTEPAVVQPSLNIAEPSPADVRGATFNSPDFTQPAAPAATEPVVDQAAPSSPPTSPAPTAPQSAYTLPNTTTPAAASSSPALEAYKLKNAWAAVEQHVKAGKLRDALEELSPFANNPHLTQDDRRAVHNWLDALAGKVIYGPEHYLSQPFRASSGQSLYDVAAHCKLPVQLLQNINSQTVKDPSVLLPGTELKVIPGPFRAELGLTDGELTLFVGPLYAGRFAFTVGEEKPAPGTYQVVSKDGARAYVGRDRQIPAGDPTNPYGNCWIDLGRQASLHGSPATAGQGPALGCISFSPQDAQDLYNILSVTSEVVIKP
jgi:hypothetical protein